MDRSTVCGKLREHWDELRMATLVRLGNELYAMDVEEVCEKIMKGDVTFGPLDLSKGDWGAELRAEAIDACAYHLFSILSGQSDE